MKRAWVPILVIAVLVTSPEAAHACAVCFDPREENRFAFLATAAFLTLFPLSLVGSVGLFIRKRVKDRDQDEGHETEADEST